MYSVTVNDGGWIQAWMMFFADTGTLPPPFNLIPNPRLLYDVGRWVVTRVKSGGGTQARCSVQRCCYLQTHSGDTAATHDEDEYQQLMSTLLQRYFMAVDDAKKESGNSKELSSTKG